MNRPAESESAVAVDRPAAVADPAEAIAHLSAAWWEQANRRLVGKALSEFAHERLLLPEPMGDGRYRVAADDGNASYLFRARRFALDHWQVDEASLSVVRGGSAGAPSICDLVLDLRDSLGLSDRVLPVYLEELQSTLASHAYRMSLPRLPIDRLAAADFQRIEAAMLEGHPCFVANSGRLGFDARAYLSYAPETGNAIRLLWVAADRAYATFTSAEGLDERTLLQEELDPQTLRGFADRLAEAGKTVDDVHLIPVHPWQWWNKLAVTFAGEIAEGRLVLLGEGPDLMQPQQSIRTFFNRSAPHRHYVKTALSVLNMGFMRGLSAAYMEATPAINDWVGELIASDPVLRESGVGILPERAAVGYHHPTFDAATRPGSPYRKMLAALWRQSPAGEVWDGERLMTMAALLHVEPERDEHGDGRGPDREWTGGAFVVELIRRSGMAPAGWLERYLRAYLVPLLHCMYAYDLAFMPHGENVILVLDENDVPRRVLLKDIAEEVVLMNAEAQVPDGVRRIVAETPETEKSLAILTDVLDCFFRFLAPILDDAGVLAEADFWRTVASCIREYQASAPELADRFARYDLFAPEFPLSCLNRLQLADNQNMVNLQNQAESLQFAGTLPNPLPAPSSAK